MAQGSGILSHVKEMPIIGGPNDVRSDVTDLDAEIGARLQILDPQRIKATALEIAAVDHEMRVITDLGGGAGRIALSFRDLIHIEENFLGSRRRSFPSQIHW